MRQPQLSDADFTELVASHTSFTAVAKAMGTSSHAAVKSRAERLGLDLSHFTGRAWRAGQTFGPSPLRVSLESKKRVTAHTVLSRGLLERRCSECGLTEWNGQPVPLELDHVNGNRHDNRLANLRLLCCNCHALTPTWRGRNWGAYKTDITL